MTALSAGDPVEPPQQPVGRASAVLGESGDRAVPVEIWYPAQHSDAPVTAYDLLPGISFAAAHAQHEPPPAAGPFPLVVLTHGRTGMRTAYTLLAEALAARGAVVVAPDHAGDTLVDWLTGAAASDVDNEVNRVGDLRTVLDAVVPTSGTPSLAIGAHVDARRVAVVGHSYGAHGALAAVAGRRGTPPETRIAAVVGLMPYTRLVSDAALERVDVPVLLVAGAQDRTTPATTDVDRPWELIPGRPLWRLDVDRAAHQAPSDMGLYADMAHLVPLPDVVRAYLDATTVDAVGEGLAPYRWLLGIQVHAVWAFLDAVLGGSAAAADLAALQGDGLHLSRRERAAGHPEAGSAPYSTMNKDGPS